METGASITTGRFGNRPGGCSVAGTDGTLRIDRGHLSANPDDAIKEPIADEEVQLYESNDHHRNEIDCIRE